MEPQKIPTKLSKSLKKTKKKRNKLSRFLMGAVIGSAVGSIVGLTLAPKSGRELRGQIAQNSKKTWHQVKDIVETKQQNRQKRGFWHFLNLQLSKMSRNY
jgi:gas vesicle protein